jgi:TPR repeat protein
VVASYCSPACQKAHWKTHKTECKDEARRISEQILFEAEKGDVRAMLNAGSRYCHGMGVVKDVKEAARWYLAAAEAGDAAAQLKIGFHYANGIGVAQDHALAFRWYSAAAEAGDHTAQFNLGPMVGVSKRMAASLCTGTASPLTTVTAWPCTTSQ